MASIAILERKCTGCGLCVKNCPFSAMDMADGHPVINAACKVCGICLKNCPEKAIIRLESRSRTVDRSAWKDILVLAEVSGGHLHPVSLELIGKARELAGPLGWKVHALLIGHEVSACAQELLHYGVDRVSIYDHDALSYFRADVYAACMEDEILRSRQSVVLIGATALGRSLAPRVATRFRTGLTADCTRLELRENSDLVQIRPAFGGNIMAQIVTSFSRPQFATVRYQVMNAPERSPETSGTLETHPLPAKARSATTLVSRTPIPPARSICDADILVVGGRGLNRESDLDMIRDLADALHGDWAVSRPLVEKGWASNDRQIGLSGRTVRPRLILTFGVSGAIQFTSCMNASEHIVSVNTDPDAPIFSVAHVAVVADLYEVLPEMIRSIRGGSREEA